MPEHKRYGKMYFLLVHDTILTNHIVGLVVASVRKLNLVFAFIKTVLLRQRDKRREKDQWNEETDISLAENLACWIAGIPYVLKIPFISLFENFLYQ